MRELGLGQPEIAWHTMRDRIAEVGCFLGLVTGTLGKISMDVKLMMQTEVEEVYEPFAEGRGSSSTMPQKRNPISSNYIHACVSMVRQHVAALLDAMVEDHERSTGPWEIEWIAVPEIFCLSAGALAQARFLVGGLQVDPARMRANLDLTKGLMVSEAVMMGLGPALGRQRAHDLVYDICRAVIAGQGSFLDLLATHPEIAPHMRRDQLAALLDPANYWGLPARWWTGCWRCSRRGRRDHAGRHGHAGAGGRGCGHRGAGRAGWPRPAQRRVTTTSRYSPGTTSPAAPPRSKRSSRSSRSRSSSPCRGGSSASEGLVHRAVVRCGRPPSKCAAER